jgi:tRNA pseudouridine55 synthase
VLGVGAHLTALQRTRTGSFALQDAMTLEVLDDLMQETAWDKLAAPSDSVLDHLPRVSMDEDETIAWLQGKVLGRNQPAWAGESVRTYDVHGHWRGIGRMDDTGQILQPVKVIPVEL